MKQVQTDYIIFASTLGFNIIWQVNGQVKIKVFRNYTAPRLLMTIIMTQYEEDQISSKMFHITEL